MDCGVFSVPKKYRFFTTVGGNAMFRRGAYLAEHTLQAASVEFVPRRGTNYARSRLQKLVGKPQMGFPTV